jgi:ketosteroid isomerase-like protein
MSPLTRAIISLAAGLLVGCATTQTRDQEMIAAARKVDRHFVEAFNRGDIDAVMSNYWNSPDLIVYPPTALEAHGYKAVREAMLQGLANAPGAQLTLADPRYQVSGDLVICHGKWRMTLPSKDGIPFVVEGRYTDLKAERDGKWVFILDHASIPWPLAP